MSMESFIKEIMLPDFSCKKLRQSQHLLDEKLKPYNANNSFTLQCKQLIYLTMQTNNSSLCLLMVKLSLAWDNAQLGQRAECDRAVVLNLFGPIDHLKNIRWATLLC